MKHFLKQPDGFDALLAQVGARELVETLATLCDDAVAFAVDADQHIVWWSEGGERLLGFSAQEVLGQPCTTANRCGECMVGCGLREQGAVDGAEMVLYRKDGTTVTVRKSARAFRDPRQRFIGGLEVLSPVRPIERREPIAPPPGTERFHGLLSGDPAMQQVFQTIRNVAETTATTLVRGESGTGKELVARALHVESDRANKPFVPVNCAALTPSLMESELFGHIKGAFTGATANRDGIFQQANGGTLFLDEVAELPLDVQAKLLRVLEQREVIPVGCNRRIPVDLRLVAATHRSLREEVRAGRFREDLMYRLRVVPIFLPPLRDRRGDVERLLWHLIGRLSASGGRVVDTVAPEAMRVLLDHQWPGNVRELKNVIEYAFAVGRGPELRQDQLPPELSKPIGPPSSPKASQSASEEARIRAALRDANGHLGRACELLGVSRPTLWRKRKRYGI